jgi:hypothetical protein
MVNPVTVNQLEPPDFLMGADDDSWAAAALMALLEKRRRPAVWVVDVKAARRATADDDARIVESMIFYGWVGFVGFVDC